MRFTIWRSSSKRESFLDLTTRFSSSSLLLYAAAILAALCVKKGEHGGEKWRVSQRPDVSPIGCAQSAWATGWRSRPNRCDADGPLSRPRQRESPISPQAHLVHAPLTRATTRGMPISNDDHGPIHPSPHGRSPSVHIRGGAADGLEIIGLGPGGGARLRFGAGRPELGRHVEGSRFLFHSPLR